MNKAVKVEDIRRHIRHKGAAIVTFMNNPIGKAVIQALEDEFYHGELADTGNTNQTFYNLGRRDVVAYMKQLQRIAENDDNADGTT